MWSRRQAQAGTLPLPVGTTRRKSLQLRPLPLALLAISLLTSSALLFFLTWPANQAEIRSANVVLVDSSELKATAKLAESFDLAFDDPLPKEIARIDVLEKKKVLPKKVLPTPPERASASLRGVSPNMTGRYNMLSSLGCEQNGHAVDLTSNMINDDFCDCDNGVDEPGTAACENGRFFCPTEEKEILSSRVNDGVCDCCDGADEWQSNVACPDACQAIRDARVAQAQMQVQAALLRREYVAAGQKAVREHQPGAHNWGSEAAFYRLSQGCLEHDAGEFKYSLCLFTKATQADHSGRATSLGNKFQWLTVDKEAQLSHGEPCPNGVTRSVTIEMKCALKDSLAAVNERERCRYEMLLETPAAC